MILSSGGIIWFASCLLDALLYAALHRLCGYMPKSDHEQVHEVSIVA